MQKKTSLVRDIIVVGFALFSMFFRRGQRDFPALSGPGVRFPVGVGLRYLFIADIGLAMLAMFALLRVAAVRLWSAAWARYPQRY